MDFKSLLNKLDSMEAPEATPKAPTLPASVRLDEDAQLRVLSGRSTYVAEAKKKDDDDKKADDKKKANKKDEKVEEGFPTVADAQARAEKEKTTGKFDKKDTSTGTVYTRKSSTFTDGGDDADTKKAKKKAKQDESIEADQFKSKFAKMVAEAKKKKPDENDDGIPDYAQDGKGAKDLGKGKKPAAKDGDDKKSGKKGMSAKQEKFFGKKKTVKESVEPKMGFREMMKLVIESGGQQQIDPKDQELFAWASRVAKTKLGEGMKAEVYAGMVYERMGGVFEMYDVLSEAKK
jgi:hypothetical protein